MSIQPTTYPDIFVSDDAGNDNPTIVSPNAYYTIQLAMTKDRSYDLEEYNHFIESAIRDFRHSRTYSHYKAYLMDMGMNCCQFHPYICNKDEDNQMATLEMHHCMLNIYDIAVMISETYLNIEGKLTEFDLAEILRQEHMENRIPIVMLCKSCHQQYHHKYLYVPPNMIFGKWWELLDRYKIGMTRDIAYKVMMYINRCSTEERLDHQLERGRKLLQLRDELLNFSATGCMVK